MSEQVSLSQPASFGGRKRLKTILIVMMLLSPLLWLFILVEPKKLFKTRNEIYCSDAPNVKKIIFQTYYLTVEQVDCPFVVVITNLLIRYQ